MSLRSVLLRRKLRLIEQFARPLPPLLAALFEDGATGALVLGRDGRIVRTNRRLDAMLAAGGASVPGSRILTAAGGAFAATGGTPAVGRGMSGAGSATPVAAAGTPITAGRAAVAATNDSPAAVIEATVDPGGVAPGWIGTAQDTPIETLFAMADRSRVATALAAALSGTAPASLQYGWMAGPRPRHPWWRCRSPRCAKATASFPDCCCA